ncbi:hypothetical protein M9H77_09654 [Catharanthus roseus]|uniref:Uncharacterized protein n=1 Tax=Catharanthus roseus TaxID=4058 RepID=A0ACC0C1K3_CATRO|nr:hypothetical protein M9H77_09654 [Catharanthus roseus]
MNMTLVGITAVVQSLTEVKKTAVRDIGFESLLSVRLTRLPKKLAMYLVQRFNVHEMSIKLENSIINIDEAGVNLVLGIPHGAKEVEDSNKQFNETEEHKAFIKEMKEKYTKFSPPVSAVQKRLIDSKNSGDYFKREFVLFCITSSIHQTLLKTLRPNLL